MKYVCKYLDFQDFDNSWVDYAYRLTKEGACKAEKEFKFGLIEAKKVRIKEIEDEIEEAKKTDDNEEIESLKDCLEWEIDKNPLEHYIFKIEPVEVKE